MLVHKTNSLQNLPIATRTQSKKQKNFTLIHSTPITSRTRSYHKQSPSTFSSIANMLHHINAVFQDSL